MTKEIEGYEGYEGIDVRLLKFVLDEVNARNLHLSCYKEGRRFSLVSKEHEVVNDLKVYPVVLSWCYFMDIIRYLFNLPS